MTREEQERLIQGYLDRLLTPPELEALDRLLVTDAEFRRAFVEASRHESFLEGSLKELSTPSAAAPQRSAPGEKTPPRGSVRPPSRRRLDRRFASSGPSSWTPALIAAGVLFVIVLLATYRGSGPKAPPGTRPEPQARTKPAEGRLPEPLPAAPRVPEEQPRKEPKPSTETPPDAARDDERERVRRIEEEIRRQQEELRKKPPDPAPATPPRPAPPERPQPEVERPSVTHVAVAQVESADGIVSLLTPSGKRPVQGTEGVLPGQGVEVAGPRGRAVVTFADGTRLQLGPGTEIQEIRAEGGKRVVVARGSVTADVAKQPKDEPMRFPTPHGEAKVLGTTLKLLVDPDPRKGTRLEVLEGLVQLTRKSDGRTVDVPSGHFTVAATGVNLETRRSPITEIVLLPKDGRIKGAEDWKKVPDPEALSGTALLSPRAWTSDLSPAALKQGSLGYVEFTFEAEADQEYTVWIRAKVGSNSDIAHDAVGLSVANGSFVTRCGFFAKQGIPDTYLFTAYYQQKGYWWGDILDNPPGGPVALTPIRVKFTGLDKPTLRLYPCEGPIRVDALWLTTTQKQKPDADHPIPAAAAAKVKGR